MDNNIKNQVKGLWEVWLNTPENSIEKDKISAELAKFIICDIDLDNISQIETENGLDNIVDVIVECNAATEQILQLYQTVFPLIINESIEFQDKVKTLKNKLEQRINSCCIKKKKRDVDWKFASIVLLLVILIIISSLNIYINNF